MTNEKIYQIQDRLREKLRDANQATEELNWGSGYEQEMVGAFTKAIEGVALQFGGVSEKYWNNDLARNAILTCVSRPAYRRAETIERILKNSEKVFGTQDQPVSGLENRMNANDLRVYSLDGKTVASQDILGNPACLSYDGWASKTMTEGENNSFLERTLTKKEFEEVLQRAITSSKVAPYPAFYQFVKEYCASNPEASELSNQMDIKLKKYKEKAIIDREKQQERNAKWRQENEAGMDVLKNVIGLLSR